ncbi:MAG: DUF2141 domain-containing protein [Bacteroidetes bacterium]|nr:MAG: DUF2141 domain-containing protein [Bacteroidota bacterium]
MFIYFVLLFPFLTISSEDGQHDLHLSLSGNGSTRGHYFIAIYRKSDPFPSSTHAFKRIVRKGAEREVYLGQLPRGTYAIAVFHDENDNAILDKNLLGIPLEKYGFSNNARATFSAPSFQEASFNLNTNRHLHVKLK